MGDVARLLFDGDGYPERLRALRRPPGTLFVRGRLLPLSPSVAIVGSRRASAEGLALAERIARAVAARGVLVISGGALGVDAAAHRGALAGGGRTLVVLPSPVHAPVPRAHGALFREVLAGGGAWVSEHEGAAGRHHFATRNRIIAALADLVLVVEARERSGTRHTIAAARQLARPLAAVPWAVGDPRGAGCLEVLTAGGRVVTSGADVAALLGLAAPPPRRRAPAPEGAPPTGASLDARILAALARGPDGVEGLAARLGAAVPALFAELTRLELRGAITRVGGRFAPVD